MAHAQHHNPKGSGLKRETDYYDETIAFLSRDTQCASFASEAVSIVVSISSIHRVLEHTAWAIYMALAGIVSVPSPVDLYRMAHRVPECMCKHFMPNIIWGAIDDTLQPCPKWVRQYPALYGKYFNGRKQYSSLHMSTIKC